MTDASAAVPTSSTLRRILPDWPLVIWMFFLTLALGLLSGMQVPDMIHEFNSGFGRALGEFALILLPSFTLAATLSRQNVTSEAAGRTSALASPIAGAGMICPDTAYAAISPAAGRYKLDAAFGAYAGFKLLYPAGPLIVATGLGATGTNGVEPVMLLLYGIALMVPVWAIGVIWGRFSLGVRPITDAPESAGASGHLLITFAPFLLLASLLTIGGVVGHIGVVALDFLFTPKGALIAAATLALLQTPSDERRGCLDSAVRRTGSLLLLIGAASAFGAVLTSLLELDRFVPQGNGVLTLIGLFGLTVLFKLVQGSSMATFAAIAPIAAPIVIASGVDTVTAVFAICLGSFVAILPNDSYYWLVRQDLLEGAKGEGRFLRIISCGATLQGLAGMALLLAFVILWQV